MAVIKWVTSEKKPAKKIHKKKEELTERDIKELMGMNMPRYEKRGGAFRQR